MGFNLYHCQTNADQRQETYDQPTRTILSGPRGPIASYVTSVCKPEGLTSWNISELEMIALLQTERAATDTALIFESSSAQSGHITFYRLQTVHGRSTSDTTEMIFRFRSLFANHPTSDPALYRRQFSVASESTAPHIYENLKLSGGLNGGTWKWMEIEQILNATMISPLEPARRN